MDIYIKPVDFLLIEDNANDAELTVRALKKVVSTENLLILEDGEDALNFLFKNGNNAKHSELKKIKAIFLDLKLPKISGLEILKEIKNSNVLKKIPVIVLTSSKEVSDIKTAYQMGANSYIVKPLDYETFVSTITAIGKYWLIMNETIE